MAADGKEVEMTKGTLAGATARSRVARTSLGNGPITVLLMATAPRPGMSNSLDSLEKHGYIDDASPSDACARNSFARRRILAMGKPWGGWRHRMQEYRDAAAAAFDRDPTAAIVCMDAYDTVCLRPAADLYGTFESFGKPLVLSLEPACGTNCISIRDWWQTDGQPYLESTGGKPPEHRYVNGGLLMGYAWAVRDLYDWMLRSGSSDDQRGLARYALAHRDQWAPDVEGRIFHNKIYGARLSERDLQGQGAFFAHFPGFTGWSDAGYKEAVQRVLNRESNVKSSNLGTPWHLAARITAAVLAVVLLVVVIMYLVWRRPWTLPGAPTVESVQTTSPTVRV